VIERLLPFDIVCVMRERTRAFTLDYTDLAIRK
jgi:hypothetical protein